MKLELLSAKYWDAEEILVSYPQIKKCFKVEEAEKDGEVVVYITFNSLDDLARFTKVVGYGIVFNTSEVTIYDYYLE